MPAFQYVTMVAEGGVPVRLANQNGTPLPTTGRGQLVFGDNPRLVNPIIEGLQWQGALGVPMGGRTDPSLYFGPQSNKDGFYSPVQNTVVGVIKGEERLLMGEAGITVNGNITALGTISGSGILPDAPSNSQIYGRRNNTWVVVPTGGGGGGGGGDDLQTTPVGAIGSTVEQPIPNWLAGAPIITLSGDSVTLAPDHLGCWLHVTNNIGVAVYLPDDWLPGWSVGIRQQGEGAVTWFAVGNSTLQIPFTRNSHTHILEQYEEVIFRVVANSDGSHAVWSVSGATG